MIAEWYEDEFGNIIVERTFYHDDGTSEFTRSSHDTFEDAREYAMRRWGAELEY